MTVHTFPSTGDAYDTTQCDESIKTGDILHVADEGVVGLAWTWPLAITTSAGHLHQPRSAADVLSLLADAGITADQLQHALSFARSQTRPFNLKNSDRGAAPY